MRVSSFCAGLRPRLSAGTIIISDPSSVEFQQSVARWTIHGLQTPGAIIKLASEADVVETVVAAAHTQVPFVVAAGGHSNWSTIGSGGFILDLTLLQNITVDGEADYEADCDNTPTVTVEAGVLAKDVMVALADVGRCTTLPDSNTVAVVSYALGGGTNPLLGVLGFACGHIVSARIVTASGKLLTVSKDSHPELLWALRGAGHLFGVVTALALQTFPMAETAGNDKGNVFRGFYLFPMERAIEVATTAMRTLFDSTEHRTVGYLMVFASPPAGEPLIAVLGTYFGVDPKQDGPGAFAAISELGPLMTETTIVPFEAWADSNDFINAKGDFKRFHIAGGQMLTPEAFELVCARFRQLVTDCPDATRSGVYYKWYSRGHEMPVAEDTAFGKRQIYQWMDVFSWYTDAAHHAAVDAWERDTFSALLPLDQYFWYGGCDREAPVGQRFMGAEKTERLRALKQEWDPEGVFTRQFL